MLPGLQIAVGVVALIAVIASTKSETPAGFIGYIFGCSAAGALIGAAIQRML
jgi:hypothetical protein